MQDPQMPPLPPNIIDPTQKDEKAKIGFYGISTGLVIAVAIGFIALVVGIIAVFNSGSSQQFQGFMKNIESETEQLKESQPAAVAEKTSEPEIIPY